MKCKGIKDHNYCLNCPYDECMTDLKGNLPENKHQRYYRRHQQKVLDYHHTEKYKARARENAIAYRERNRDRLRENAKRYREKHRDEINARKREKCVRMKEKLGA